MDPRTLLERLARRPGPSPELSGALADLDRLGTNRPDLASPARSLGRLIAVAFQVPDASEVEVPDTELVARLAIEGVPAFRAIVPKLDASSLARRARMIASEIGGAEAGKLGGALRKGRVDVVSWLRDAFAGHHGRVAEMTVEAGLNPDLTTSVLRLASLPSLARWSSAIDRARPEGAWIRGDCPDCGASPLLAESRGLEQRIFYRCGLCAGDWPGERLRCPGCGESSSKALHYAFVEGEQERYRLARCEACGGSWKVVSTLGPLSAPGLLVAELATFHLDVLAVQVGPAPP